MGVGGELGGVALLALTLSLITGTSLPGDLTSRGPTCFTFFRFLIECAVH